MTPRQLPPQVRRLVKMALKEDLGHAGDITTRFFVPPGSRLKGAIVAKEAGILCGMAVAREVFQQACPEARFTPLSSDGRGLRPGQAVARVDGPRCILTAERTALNFLQRLSGIATLTRAYADALRGTRARLYDTRKTLPGWRALDKYAVRCGGGFNHRLGLYDMAMLKDNHYTRTGDLRESLRRFNRRRGRVPVLMEAKTHDQVRAAVDAGADIVLLDNMPPARLAREIRFIRGRSRRVLIEVSGGVSLAKIRRIARLGPDRISVGAITHSATAVDLSLELE